MLQERSDIAVQEDIGETSASFNSADAAGQPDMADMGAAVFGGSEACALSVLVGYSSASAMAVAATVLVAAPLCVWGTFKLIRWYGRRPS